MKCLSKVNVLENARRLTVLTYNTHNNISYYGKVKINTYRKIDYILYEYIVFNFFVSFRFDDF